MMSPTGKERRATGKTLRHKCAKNAHAAWKAHVKRRDPIDLLIESNAGRMPQLVLIRFGQNERDYQALLKAICDGQLTTFDE